MKMVPFAETRNTRRRDRILGGRLVERDCGTVRAPLWYHGQRQGSPEALSTTCRAVVLDSCGLKISRGANLTCRLPGPQMFFVSVSGAPGVQGPAF